jgi:hypothetical protein
MTKNAPVGTTGTIIGNSIMPNGNKFQNELMFAVKGQLIPDYYSQSDIDHMEKQYIKRLWGNCEAIPNNQDRFEQAWSKANG